MYRKFVNEYQIDFVCKEYSGLELAEIIFKILEKQKNTSYILLDFTACREQGVFSD